MVNRGAQKERIAELEYSAGGVSSVLFEKHDFRLNRGNNARILGRVDFALSYSNGMSEEVTRFFLYFKKVDFLND